MSFYLTYRPKIISELDNQTVRDFLVNLAKTDRAKLPHAYLLTGTRGIGKTTTARILAKLFLCTDHTQGDRPCGTCASCLSIAAGTHMDVIEMDAASNRGIDEIRAIRETIGLAPTSGLFKVYIIDEVHMLTTEAFNALLKTLEEPPVHAIFILATTTIEKVPETIRSRCTAITYTRATAKELKTALKRVTKGESISIDDDAVERLLELADGSFRDAVKLLETVSLVTKKITRSDLDARLSTTSATELTALVDALLATDRHGTFAALKRIIAANIDLKQCTVDAITHLETMLINEVMDKDDSMHTTRYLTLIRMLSRAYADFRTMPYPRLALELAIGEYFLVTDAAGSQPDGGSESAFVDKPLMEEKVVSKKEPREGTKKDAATLREEMVSQKVSSPVSTHTEAIPLTMEKFTTHFRDFIDDVKLSNNSLAGFLRSTRPKSVGNGIVTLEAFYQLHRDKLSETKAKENMIASVKKLFGAKVTVEIVLGKK